MDADVITFEAARSNLSLLDALASGGFETDVGPGVYDIHSPRGPCRTKLTACTLSRRFAELTSSRRSCAR
jgi:5-methyltetrahydropteroyltriglutamate--homocysteine methyltransferase